MIFKANFFFDRWPSTIFLVQSDIGLSRSSEIFERKTEPSDLHKPILELALHY